MTLRSLLALALSALCVFAQAQPAPAASAASAPALTFNTPCGAAGTGNAMRYTAESPSRRVPLPETREASKAKPGEWASLVDGAGVWQACRMPPKPKHCQPMPVPAKWAGEGNKQCGSSLGALLPARDISPVDVTVYSQGYFAANPAPGQRRGSLTYECRPEGWVLIRQSCQ